jgi:hypothetical protein
MSASKLFNLWPVLAAVLVMSFLLSLGFDPGF